MNTSNSLHPQWHLLNMCMWPITHLIWFERQNKVLLIEVLHLVGINGHAVQRLSTFNQSISSISSLTWICLIMLDYELKLLVHLIYIHLHVTLQIGVGLHHQRHDVISWEMSEHFHPTLFKSQTLGNIGLNNWYTTRIYYFIIVSMLTVQTGSIIEPTC